VEGLLSLCAAMCGNDMTCTAIDNFTAIGKRAREAFLTNFARSKGGNEAQFIQQNCWDVDARELSTAVAGFG
jgi:hypothetical protein